MEISTKKNIVFGIEFKNTKFLDKKIELLQAAIISPIVSEDLFETLYNKLAKDELSDEKILTNIAKLKSDMVLNDEEINIVAERIDYLLQKHQVTTNEIKSLFLIKPELIAVLGYKTIKCAKDISNLLQTKVFGQNGTLDLISVFFYQWQSYWNAKNNSVYAIAPPQKAKLIIGGTGCGKTFIINEIAKLLQFEIIRIDAATLVQTGYVGNNLSTDIISGMIDKGCLISENKKFLIFIDEFDKLAKQNTEIKGKTILYELLTILENKSIKGQNSYEKSAGQSEINMENVLFVCAGAFGGLIDSPKKSVGFNAKSASGTLKITTEDIIQYGIPREVMGRISAPIQLNKTSKETLMNILIHSDQGIKYYKSFFQREDIVFDFENCHQLFSALVDDAYTKNLGARGLFSSTADYFETLIIN